MPHDEHGHIQSKIMDSLSGQDASYTVAPRALECSCADWRSHRSRFPAGDLRRCCKHLVYALAREPELGPPALVGQPRVLSRIKRLAARREGFPLCRRILPVPIPADPEGKEASADLFFPLDPEASPWVSVLIGGGVFRYHPAEDRWANEDAPPTRIREALELRIHKALNQEQAARTSVVPEPATHKLPPKQSPETPADEAPQAQTSATGSGKKPLRFETPCAETNRAKPRRRRGFLIFLVILLGGVLYWADTITMPPLTKKADGPVVTGERPLPGDANGTGAVMDDPLEPPLPKDPAEPNAAAPGEPPEWDLREPLSNASLAADLLELIKRDPDRGRYTISRKVEGGTLLFGADLDLDVIFRIYRGDDGAERRDRWIGHITHRLQSAAAGGSLDAVPEQGS
ncbi:MAG: hypothetical protein ACOCWR_10700 [Oceanidesulfovibrio sp.]